MPTTDTDTSHGFEEWLTEGMRLSDAAAPDHQGALVCATTAAGMAKTTIEWARAAHTAGIEQFHLGQAEEATGTFTTLAGHLAASPGAEERYWHARALYNKGVILGVLGRFADEIANASFDLQLTLIHNRHSVANGFDFT